MLDHGCTVPILAKFVFTKQTTAKFYPVTRSDKDWLEQTREDVVGRSSMKLTKKTAVSKVFVRDSPNKCMTTVGIDTIALCVKRCPHVCIRNES